MSATQHTGRDGIAGQAGRIARDVGCLWRRKGPRAALAAIAEVARWRVYRVSDQIYMSKELTASEPDQEPRSVRIERADVRHLPQVCEFYRQRCNTRRAHYFARSIERGGMALLGFHGDDLIGYFWWLDAERSDDVFGGIPVGATIAPHEAYGHNLFIAPEHRGGGIATDFLAGIEAELVRLGYRRVRGFVERDNRPARWLYAIAGYEAVGEAKMRTVLGRLTIVDGTPYVSGRRGTRPLLRGRAMTGRRAHSPSG